MTPGPNKNTGAKSGKSGPVDQNYNSAYNCSLLSQKAYDPDQTEKKDAPFKRAQYTEKRARGVCYYCYLHCSCPLRYRGAAYHENIWRCLCDSIARAR